MSSVVSNTNQTLLLSIVGDNYGSNSKWSGSVLGPDQHICGIRFTKCVQKIHKIDPKSGSTSLTGGNLNRGWQDAVVGHGKVYALPHSATSILGFNTSSQASFSVQTVILY